MGLKESMVDRLEGRCRNLTTDKEQLESVLEDFKCQNSKEKTELEAKNIDLNSESIKLVHSCTVWYFWYFRASL